MERVFSVDDILGTFWKLEAQGEGTNAAATPSAAGNAAGAAPQNGAEITRPIPRTGSFHRMNRSSSEWAFQEFIKEHVAGGGFSQVLSQSSSLDKLLLVESPSKGALADGAAAEDVEAKPGPGKGRERGEHGGQKEQGSSKERVLESHGAVLDANGDGSRQAMPLYAPPVDLSGGQLLRPLFSTMGDDAAAAGGSPPEYTADVLKERLMMACAVASSRGRLPGGEAPSASQASVGHGPGQEGLGGRAAALGAIEEENNSSEHIGGGASSSAKLQRREPEGRKRAGGGRGREAEDAAGASSGARAGGQGRAVASMAMGLASSEDDDGGRSEGEDELVASLEHLTDPEEIKRVKRMLSNRESARRSRRRKQAHMSDLEIQVNELQSENANLANRLNDIGRKYNEAAVDNRVLKSDVEALRAKVRMAEEAVGRAAHMAHYLYPMPFRHDPTSLPFPGADLPYYPRPCRPGQTSPNPYAMPGPLPHDPSRPNGTPPPGIAGLLPGAPPVAEKLERSPSMQRVASLEHLQKRIRGGPPSAASWGQDWEGGEENEPPSKSQTEKKG